MFELRDTEDRNSALIASACVQYSANGIEVALKSSFWKDVAATLEGVDGWGLYELVSEYLDKSDLEAQTPQSAQILFRSVQEEFCLSKDALVAYLQQSEGNHVVLNTANEIQSSLKTLEALIGVALPSTVTRYDSQLFLQEEKEITVVKLDSVEDGKLVRWEIQRTACVHSGEVVAASSAWGTGELR